MEYYWNNSSSSSNATTTVRGHNGNFITNPAWDSSWDLATATATTLTPTPTTAAARPDWNYYSPPQQPAAARKPEAAAFPAQHQDKNCSSAAITSSSPPLYYNPDPHLTCLKLGKRHYFGELTPPPTPAPALIAAGMGPFIPTKRGKACVESVSEEPLAAAVVPKCQVVGCEAALVNAKDYHRRHKVCEMHAKAPKVVLLGIEQRFCQQCSRFHALAEFDEAKRSCRRRLAGHNERRRKSSQEHNSLAKKHYHEIKMMGGGRNPQPHPHFLNNGECALSLLSPTNFSPWSASPSPDLPARCSAALRELIAENRASVFACRQLINSSQVGSGWAAAAPENRDHVTLNLMQGPGSCFGLISGHGRRSSEDDGSGDCSDSDLWKLPLGY